MSAFAAFIGEVCACYCIDTSQDDETSGEEIITDLPGLLELHEVQAEVGVVKVEMDEVEPEMDEVAGGAQHEALDWPGNVQT
jgi:hypothetical protein